MLSAQSQTPTLTVPGNYVHVAIKRQRDRCLGVYPDLAPASPQAANASRLSSLSESSTATPSSTWRLSSPNTSPLLCLTSLQTMTVWSTDGSSSPSAQIVSTPVALYDSPNFKPAFQISKRKFTSLVPLCYM